MRWRKPQDCAIVSPPHHNLTTICKPGKLSIAFASRELATISRRHLPLTSKVLGMANKESPGQTWV